MLGDDIVTIETKLNFSDPIELNLSLVTQLKFWKGTVTTDETHTAFSSLL